MEKTEFEKIEDWIMLRAKGCWVELGIGKFIDIYPFTTENIAGYIDKFELKEKSLLTVGSSGDQVINAALYDCTDITLLDINPFTKFYVYLKIACLLELSRENFMKFLRYNDYHPKTFEEFAKNYGCFDKCIYKRISPVLESLDKESFLIWNKLFDSFDSLDLRTNLFFLDEYDNKTIETINPYLASDDAYEMTRAKIQKTDIKFLTGNVLEVELKEKYDNIWLSNVCRYLLNPKEIKLLVDKMTNNLNGGGKLLICYLYYAHRGALIPIYQLDDVRKILKKYSLSFSTFLGIDGILGFGNKNIEDEIMYYKKK